MSRRNVRVMCLSWGLTTAISVAPLLGLRATELGVDIAKIGFILAIGNLVAAVGQVPSGYMSDRFGRKRCIVVGGLLNAIALISYSLATDWRHLVPAVILSNLAMMMTMPSRLALTSESVHAEKRGSAYGLLDAVNYVAKAAGPAAAMLVAAKLGLKWVFVFASLAALAGASVDAILLREDRCEREPARRESSPLSMEVLRHVIPFASTQALTALFSGFSGPFFYIFAVKTLGLPLAKAGLLGGAYGALMMVSRLPFGKLANKGISVQVLLMSLGCALGGAIWVVIGSGHSMWVLLAYPMLALANVMPARNALVSNLAPAESLAQSYGFIGALEGLAGAVSFAVAGWLAHRFGMRSVFVISGIGLMVTGICLRLLMARVSHGLIHEDRPDRSPGYPRMETPVLTRPVRSVDPLSD